MDPRADRAAETVAELVFATDSDFPDPDACHWRAYWGPYRTWGTIRDCTRILVRQGGGWIGLAGIRILTGREAEDHMALHGDPAADAFPGIFRA